MARQLQPCGTNAAHTRHLKAGEEPCGPCREAHNAYMREWNASPAGKPRKTREFAKSAARQAAFRKLAKRHPAEFEVLFKQELTDRGLSQ